MTLPIKTVTLAIPIDNMLGLVMQLPDDKKVELLDALQKDLEDRKVILARRNAEQLWYEGDRELYAGKEPEIDYINMDEAAPEGEEIEMTDEEFYEAVKNI
ncbi:MAG: hypothetical protein ACPGVB_05375 [Chitinophagales bacterium]